MAPKIKPINQVIMFLDCRGQVQLNKHRKLVRNFVFLKPHHIQLQPERQVTPFDWLTTATPLVSGESYTRLRVTLFEARSRIFLPIAKSCAALFCCRLANGLLAISRKISTEKHVFTLPISFSSSTLYLV